MRTAEDKAAKAPSALAEAQREFDAAAQHVEDVQLEERRRLISFMPKGAHAAFIAEGSPAWNRVMAAEAELQAARDRLNALLRDEERSRRALAQADEDAARAERMAAFRRRHVEE